MGQIRDVDKPMWYRIKLKGRLDQKWSDWLEDFTIEIDNNNTVLTGMVLDQPNLYGLLAKIRDINLPLLLVERIEIEP